MLCSSLPLAADAGDASEEELVAERYADLDYSREEELASVAGWYHPNYIEAVAGIYLKQLQWHLRQAICEVYAGQLDNISSV